MKDWIIEKVAAQLAQLTSSAVMEEIPVPVFYYLQSEPSQWQPGDPLGYASPDLDDGEWPLFSVPGDWGGIDVTAWFRATVEIPGHWQIARTAFVANTGFLDGGADCSEALLFVQGNPVQGMDRYHPEHRFSVAEIGESRRISIALKAWSTQYHAPDRRRFSRAALVLLNEETRKLSHLYGSILEVLKVLDKNDIRYVAIKALLGESYGRLDLIRFQTPAYYTSVERALAHLQKGLDALGQYNELKPIVACLGHSHLDLAWIWRKDATRDKIARTFSTALRLMERYPNYSFLHSSPWCYETLRKDFPSLYAQVDHAVREGRWQVNGSMWVEADTLLPSGESLVRQILYGKAYVQEHFGQDNAVLWLPDVFGFSYALPQIMRLCGIKTLVTSKLGWSQYNRFPHDTFFWRGMDGSRVLVQFLMSPELDVASPYGNAPTTYNSPMRAREVAGAWQRYQQKDINSEILLSFGYGDGGGGPTESMLEAAELFADVPGMPRTVYRNVEKYAADLIERMQEKDAPVWDDELYFELHRGTYTTQSLMKQKNIRLENMLRRTELLLAAAKALWAAPYPLQEMRDCWKMVLFNQFHDVLTGSSIAPVYLEALREYEDCERKLNELTQTAYQSGDDEKEGVLFVNELGWPRLGVAEVELDGRKVCVDVGEIPPLGWRCLTKETVSTLLSCRGANEVLLSGNVLENEQVRVTFGNGGQVLSIFDKRSGFEALSGPGNILTAYEDRPLDFDAWDIDRFYREKGEMVCAWVDVGEMPVQPHQRGIRVTSQFHRSTITQDIYLRDGDPAVYFATTVEWNERQTLLKTSFPVTVRARNARFGIQFGSIQRPTHENTPFDYAKFEVCAHGWSDYSDLNHGVALLCDCKYGYDVHGGSMEMTLLKSPIDPDPESGKGKHECTYALLPHGDDFAAAAIPRAAMALRSPVAAIRTRFVRPEIYSFAQCDAPEIVLDTIKLAENGRGMILRAYEHHGRACKNIAIHVSAAIQKAMACDLLEHPTGAVLLERNTLYTNFEPFEIKTFLLRGEEADEP